MKFSPEQRLDPREPAPYIAAADAAIEAGSAALKMPTGIVSQICEFEYEIIAIVSPLGLRSGMMYSLGETYCADIVGQGVSLNDANIDSASSRCFHPVYLGKKPRAFIGAPIFCESGRVVGMLDFTSTEPREPFTRDERNVVENLARKLGKRWTGWVEPVCQ